MVVKSLYLPIWNLLDIVNNVFIIRLYSVMLLVVASYQTCYEGPSPELDGSEGFRAR